MNAVLHVCNSQPKMFMGMQTNGLQTAYNIFLLVPQQHMLEVKCHSYRSSLHVHLILRVVGFYSTHNKEKTLVHSLQLINNDSVMVFEGLNMAQCIVMSWLALALHFTCCAL